MQVCIYELIEFRTAPFNTAELKTPLSDIASRISELYMMLIDLYLDLGEDFMKSFYSTSNLSLSAYMGMDICTIVKGCIFEWCLVNGDMDIRESVYRIIGNYLKPYSRTEHEN